MADVRCPMCGKANPAEAEVCRFCQARLKPLVGPQKGAESGLDWLRQLSADDSASAGGLPTELPPTPAETPDWLSRIRQRSQQEDAISPIGPAPKIGAEASDTDLPDWLKGLGSSGAEESAPVLPSEPAAVEPDADWLRGFESSTTQPKPVKPSAEEPDADWLGEFQASTKPAARIEPAQPQGDDTNLASWLQSLDGDQPATADTVGADWLSGFSASPEAVEETTEETAAPAEDIPAWVRALGPEAAPQTPAATPVENAPDEWLSGFEAEKPAESLSTSPAENMDWLQETPAAESAGGSMDWLTGLPEGGSTEAPAVEVNQSDWLQDFRAENPADELPVIEPAPVIDQPEPVMDLPIEQDLPDWLKQMEPAANKTSKPMEKAFARTGELKPPEDIPDWLQEMERMDAVPATSSASAEPTAESEAETPDWLSAFNVVGEVGESEAAFGGKDEVEIQPTGDIPDWLQAFGPIQPMKEMPVEDNVPSPFAIDLGESLQEKAGAMTSPFTESGMAEAKTPEPAPKSTGQFRTGEDLMTWIGSTEEGAGKAAESEDALETGQVPAWVAAMRPMESAAPQMNARTEDQRVEKTGPLAGLRGVLPGEDLVTSYRKPPVYSTRLRVTDKQRFHATLLENMLAEEVSPIIPVSGATQTPQIFLRIAVAAALILVLLAGFLAKVPPLVSPNLATSDMLLVNFAKSVQELPENVPVLVLTDYEGGLSGELQAAGQPVIEHLMLRNTRLVVASTLPSGALLGNKLLTAAQKNLKTPSNYNLAAQTASLGYLAGGASAAQALAAQIPLRRLAPTLLQGQWSQASLQGVNQLSSFAAVLVLTDNPETARMWIEQLRPAMGKTPLWMVTSAQAAPLVRPYVESAQLNGLTAGVVGGAAYEQNMGKPSTAFRYYNAYLLGLGMIIALILLGGVVQAVAGIVTARKGQNGV